MLRGMRTIVILAIVAVSGYFVWKRSFAKPEPEVPALRDPNKTPGANAANRIDNLSGAAPMP